MSSRRGRRPCGRRRLAAALLVVAAGIACGRARGRESGAEPDSPFRGPVVVISLSALGADARRVAPGAMARLDGFLAEATWAGTAVATASWSVGSLASVFSGLTPALHGAAHPARPSLRPSVPTLAEELASAGFATRGYFSSPWLGPGFGMDRGFQSLRRLRRGAGERWLAGLHGDPSFTWIQLGLPGPTLVAAPAAATADGDPTRRRLVEGCEEAGQAGAVAWPIPNTR